MAGGWVAFTIVRRFPGTLTLEKNMKQTGSYKTLSAWAPRFFWLLCWGLCLNRERDQGASHSRRGVRKANEANANANAAKADAAQASQKADQQMRLPRSTVDCQ